MGLDERDAVPPANGSATIFGDFEIERRDDGSLCELGRGAMGVTYRAVDKVLHRKVALKVIEPPATASDSQTVRERFLREARAAAALRHPNVAGVFHFSASPELDRCYCAMELVEGETLEARVRREGPMPVALALEIGIQVSRALMAAAERGLIHRDLKPGNIMLARGEDPARPEVKVIDFGLAKAADNAGDMELTHGGFVGTPAFASPEQFAGGTVDARCDIYALGVTLWFALTGRLPSAGTTIEEIRRRQADHKLPVEQLQSKAVPRQLIELLQSCLAIDPTNRPTSARELMRALEACRDQIASGARRRKIALGAIAALLVATAIFASVALRPKAAPDAPTLAAARPIEKGVAVLPFENLSHAEADAFFAEGIQDDVLTRLGKIRDLKVIARGSVMSFRGARRAGRLGELGQSLGVSHVLDGSVRRTEDRLVLNVALIDTRDERQVWAERYERTLNDSLALQGELALQIARALASTLTPVENRSAATAPTENPEAYVLYLRGRDAELNHNDSAKALQHYEQAITLDANFALARARYAIAASVATFQGFVHALQDRARAEAEEALRLQPELGEGWLALAYWHLYCAQDYDRARTELARAAELLPNSAEVPLISAFIDKRQKRYRERLAALRRAEALDPHNRSVRAFQVLTYRFVRDWPEAMQALDRRAAIGTGPPFLVSQWSRANDEFRLTGNIDVLKRGLALDEHGPRPMPAEVLAFARFEIAMLERDFTRASEHLRALPAEALNGSRDSQPLFVIAGHERPFYEALLAVATDAADKSQLLERAINACEKSLADHDVSQGDPNKRRVEIALLHAFAGRKEEAIRIGLETAGDKDEAASWIERNDMLAALALVYAQVGEAEKSLDLIERLLTVPAELQDGTVYNMTHADLKWRWVWDPLRSNPRFQKILAGPEPKTVY